MRFVPEYKLNIADEEEFPSYIEHITERLAECRTAGYFDSFDKKPLFYEYFLAENSKASVVVVHGLSEFTKKYYEFAEILLDQGYNVFLFDQRCHGYSCRLTDENQLIHVDKFSDYVKDLDLFIDNVVLKAEEKPVCLFSHSMGGAVSVLYLAEHPDRIEKALLSSPMIEPRVKNVTPSLARAWSWLNIVFRGKTCKFRFSGDFDPDAPHKTSLDSSRARFENQLGLRIKDTHYQTSPMTVGWIYNSLILKRKLTRKSTVDRIKTPILLLSSENDSVVSVDAQRLFADRCDRCTMELMSGAKHTLFTAEKDVLIEFYEKVIGFFNA